MNLSDIPRRRLFNQHISNAAFDHPGDEVRWLGAVQAQDYGAAKWGLGLRLRDAVDADVERAFDDGSILRTHVMRPTWHFVAPEDIRWMLELTAPRVHALNAYQYRKLELDAKVLKRTNAALVKALRGGTHRTREELRDVLERAGVRTGEPLRLGCIMMYAELEGIVCSGPRRGRQFTYALLEERAPRAVTLARDEALAELARRFFQSHGPATTHDLAKWSGLTIADARRGLEEVKGGFDHETIDGHTYWFTGTEPPPAARAPKAYLLPNYDEYTVGYRHHAAVFDTARINQLVFNHIVVIDGRVTGTWRRTLEKDSVIIESSFFAPLTKAEARAVAAAAARYGRFIGLPVVMGEK
jgi:Winged helix DNA-binding domain